MDQKARAETFHGLHDGPRVLVLANAWDAASAAVAADAGAKAVATSSAAVAWAHGYADGDVLPLETVAGAIAEIARVVDLPVTADIEGGYTDDLGELAEVIARVIAAGAVGINLEDGSRDPDLQARKIEAVRGAAGRAGVNLFINARTDVYLRKLAEGDAAEAEAIRRAKLYAEAGASGVFVPGAAEPELIRRLAGAIPLPLNIMAWPGAPDADALAGLGGRRLSAGASTFMAAYAAAAKVMAAFLADGNSDALMAAGQGAPRLQERFAD